MSADPEKNFLDNLIETVIIVDKEGKIREVNRETLELLGCETREKVVGLPFGKICKNLHLSGLKDKLPLREQELIYQDKEGKRIPVSVNITERVSYPDDIIFIARDISKTKNLIDELIQSEKELKASYEQLRSSEDDLIRSEKLAYTGRIAAGIAHEVRNPLANVSMSIQQIKKALNPKKHGAKYIEIVTRNIERVNFLITELLNSARPIKLNLQAHDIHELLKGVLDSSKTRIKLQKIKVVRDFTSQASILKIDREQMQRVFTNLILNAVEAMPKGGTLTLLTEPDKNYFLVKTKDTGKGIPEKDIIKIFDPFFSTKQQGVGLGLTICYGIIVSHGGTIGVESERRKGSVFSVSLPYGV